MISHYIAVYLVLLHVIICGKFGETAPSSYIVNRPWSGLSGTVEARANVSHSSEATVVSFGILISFIVFVILCAGGCCLNIFGKHRLQEAQTTTGFSNPIAELGLATMSPIDVRALEMDPIVFEPLPPLHDLTPVSNSFYNSLPRLDPSGVRYPRHLNNDPHGSHFPTGISLVSIDEANVYAHDWFDEPYRNNFRRDHIEYVKEVGKGWFGKVVEAEAKDIVPYAGKLRVLVKVLREDATGAEQMRFLDESRLYRDANHGNVLKLLGHSIEKLPFLLIMEHHPQGDLKSFLIANVARAELLNSQGALVRMGLDIAKGLEWMASADFVHKDLAARNCQVGSEGRIVIGDYGLAVQNFRDDYYWGSNSAIPLRWSAPETLHCTTHTIQTLKVLKSSNVWSFGVVLWEILEFGKLPYYELTDDDVISQVLTEKNYTLSKPSRPGLAMKDEMYRIMLSCWNPNPDGRPRMSTIVEQLEECFNTLNFSSSAQEVSTMSNSDSVRNQAEDDFDRKWEAVGSRLNSVSSVQNSPTVEKGCSIAANGISKKKSVSFVGTTTVDDIPEVQIIKPGNPSETFSTHTPVVLSCSPLSQLNGLAEPALVSLTNSTPPPKYAVVSGKEDEHAWKSLGSDPEEESIELAVISEKVREKSLSVQNLMVLTHVEPSDFSDPDSLTIQAHGQLNKKNLSSSSTPPNSTSSRVGVDDFSRNGTISETSQSSLRKSSSETSLSPTVTFANSWIDSKTSLSSLGRTVPVETLEDEAIYTHTLDISPTQKEKSQNSDEEFFESSSDGAVKSTLQNTSNIFLSSRLSQATGDNRPLGVASLTHSNSSETNQWETLSEETVRESSLRPDVVKPELSGNGPNPIQDSLKLATNPEISIKVLPPTLNPPVSTTPNCEIQNFCPPTLASPPARNHWTPINQHGINVPTVAIQPPTPDPGIALNVIAPTPVPPKGAETESSELLERTEPIRGESEKPSVRFVFKDDEAQSGSSGKIQQNYRARKTSTPNVSLDDTVVSGDSDIFQDASADAFENFSMELSEPLSPIGKTGRVPDLWTTGTSPSTNVVMGPSDDLGLKPYQMVTTELRLQDFEDSPYPYSDEPTTTNSTVMEMCNTEQNLQVQKSGFMDIFGVAHTPGSQASPNVYYGTYSINCKPSTGGETSQDKTIAARVVKKLEFDQDTIADVQSTGEAQIYAVKTPPSHSKVRAECSRNFLADSRDQSSSSEPESGHTFDVTHVSATPPAKTLDFKLGSDTRDSKIDGHLPKDKFLEDIEAAAEELGSLVMTDLEEEDSEVKVIKETREDSPNLSVDQNVGMSLRTRKAFEVSLDESSGSSAAGTGNDSTPAKDDDDSQQEYVELLDSSSRVSKFHPDSSRSLLYPGESDCEVDEDEREEDDSICRDFVPSRWNQNLAPVKPAIKSPEQQKFTSGSPDSSAISEKTNLKKSVSFERKKTQLVYEYPPPPVPSDSDEEEKQSGPLRSGGGHIQATLDWELQPEELENADLHQEDWDDEIVPRRSGNPMDVYRISGFDNFQVRPSDLPFDFRPAAPPPPPRLFTLLGTSDVPDKASSATIIPPMNDTSTLGELRHTRSRLKLDLAKGEASLLDSEASSCSSGTKVIAGKPQQIDSGVGSSTNPSPFNNCDTSD